MNAESNMALQHTLLFSDHKQFEVQFMRDLKFSLISPDNYAGIFYTLMGYFSTIQGTDLNDQVSSELIKTFNILITGSDYDRFYVLIMAKTMVSERLTGRLFYFHLNENAPFLTDHFSMSDIDIIYHYLRLEDPYLDDATLVQWIRHVENNLLFIRIKKGQLGINSNEQPTEKCFVVDATFYRTINLFRRDRLDATLWRKLKMTNLIGKNTKHHFFQLSKQIYNALFIAFMKNSNPTSNGGPLKFILSKEHFLRFVHGALQYSIKIFYLIKITPIYVGSYLEKLAILEYNQKNWVADSPPIIFEAHESFHEASMAQTATKIDDLPIDFSSNAEFALINTVIFGLTNDIESAQFSTKQVQIENKSGLIHLLEQTIKLENDQYYQKFFEVRKELLLQLSRIDAFLGHEHRTSYLRHFIFGALITAGLENPAFKLKHRFDELNPVDIFLIKSSESSGIVVAMSKNVISASVSDPIADIILNTGLKKLLVLTINDQAYEHLVDVENEMNPLLGMITRDIITHGTVDFNPSHWGFINPILSGHCFSKMMIDQHEQHERSTLLQNELTYHSMGPNSLREFEAQMKGFAAGQQIFTPYGYDQVFIGISIDNFEGFEDINRFSFAIFRGRTQHAFHIILQLNPNEQNTNLNNLKSFFKKQLLSSGLGKINTVLIQPSIFRDTDNSIKYKFVGSFPNGRDAHEYAECLSRRTTRADGQNCLQVEEEKDNSELIFEDEQTAKMLGIMEGVVKIGKLVNKAIYFQMIKGIIGSAMDGDFTRMAKEGGILAGMFGVGVAGDFAVQWGRSLLKRKNPIKGGAAYLGGKLLFKAYLGFVIADLLARYKAYQMGDKEQLVGIVGDTAILTINVIPLTLEIYSTFASIEEASIELGPGVMIAEAAIFATIDGFYAARRVQKINKQLQLSWGENFVQWTKPFFGAQTSTYLEGLKCGKKNYYKWRLMMLQRSFDFKTIHSDIMQLQLFKLTEKARFSNKKIISST